MTRVPGHTGRRLLPHCLLEGKRWGHTRTVLRLQGRLLMQCQLMIKLFGKWVLYLIWISGWFDFSWSECDSWFVKFRLHPSDGRNAIFSMEWSSLQRKSGSDSDQTVPLPLRVTSGWQPQSFPSQLDLCFLGITRKATLNSLPTIISKELNVLLMLIEFTSFWGCWIITRWKTWHSAYIRRRLDNLSKKKSLVPEILKNFVEWEEVTAVLTWGWLEVGSSACKLPPFYKEPQPKLHREGKYCLFRIAVA